jgi:hypothetical protein
MCKIINPSDEKVEQSTLMCKIINPSGEKVE